MVYHGLSIVSNRSTASEYIATVVVLCLQIRTYHLTKCDGLVWNKQRQMVLQPCDTEPLAQEPG